MLTRLPWSGLFDDGGLSRQRANGGQPVLTHRASGRATSASAPTTFHFNLRGGVNSGQIVVVKKPEQVVDRSGLLTVPAVGLIPL
jgi:hypothetical protein